MTKNNEADKEGASAGVVLERIVSALGDDGWKTLLRIVESIHPPFDQPVDKEGEIESFGSDVVFTVGGGWSFTIFYDCGEMDYIDSFTLPSGDVFDFWELEQSNFWRSRLTAWNDVGDLEWLAAH